MTASGFLSVWHWFSGDHAIAATTLSRQCGDLEADPPRPNEDERGRNLTYQEVTARAHRSAAIGSILSSVGFLEASINEFFASSQHDNLNLSGGALPEHDRQVVAAASDLVGKNKTTLDRYQLALHLLHYDPFDHGLEPYQDANLLVRLRNAIVHYTPQWRPHADGPTTDKLSLALEGKGFPQNPFTGAGNPFLLDRCLGHGCTTWAWQASLALVDDFLRRAGVSGVHHQMRELLVP
jgi:hypothetical protein